MMLGGWKWTDEAEGELEGVDVNIPLDCIY